MASGQGQNAYALPHERLIALSWLDCPNSDIRMLESRGVHTSFPGVPLPMISLVSSRKMEHPSAEAIVVGLIFTFIGIEERLGLLLDCAVFPENNRRAWAAGIFYRVENRRCIGVDLEIIDGEHPIGQRGQDQALLRLSGQSRKVCIPPITLVLRPWRGDEVGDRGNGRLSR